MHDCNVGINDPANGVWLPAGSKDVPHFLPTLKRALPHSPLHTKEYERWVNLRIQPAKNETSARHALLQMRLSLLNGLNNPELISTLSEKTRKKLGL